MRGRAGWLLLLHGSRDVIGVPLQCFELHKISPQVVKECPVPVPKEKKRKEKKRLLRRPKQC